MKENNQVGRILKRFQESDKKKPAQVLAGFLIIMMILGAISRGIYAYMLPRINVTAPSRGSIVHTITGEGTVQAEDCYAINVLPDIIVKDICIEKGSVVATGDPLMELDIEQLNQNLEDKSDEIAILQMEIEDLESSAAHNSQVDNLTSQRADEDYELSVSGAQLQLEEANEALEVAIAVSTNRISREEYIRDAVGSDGGVIAAQQAVHELESAGIKEGSTYDNAKEYMDLLIYIATQTAEKAYDAETEKIAQDIEAARNTVESTELKVEEAILNAERDVEDAALSPVSDHSAQIKAIQLENLLEEKAIFEQMLSQNGIIYAPKDGVICEIMVKEGSKTSTDAAFILAVSEGTYSIQAPISEDNRKYVAVGNSVYLAFPGSGAKTNEAVVEQMIQENGQNYLVISFDASVAQIGEIGEFTIETQGITADVTVPIQALHSDGIRYFVYITERQNTILGEEITVTMRVVSIGEKNDRTVELINSGLSSDSEVITDSDKAIGDGDTVRMAEQ